MMRVIVNGAKGKMGTLACDTLKNHPEFELVAALGREDDLSSTIQSKKADIVVDLTRADVVYENSLCIIENGAHPVIGASGLLEDQIKTIKALCAEKNTGGIIVPNFSIAAVLMMHFAAMAAKWLPEVEIIEAHHQNKLDAPSGTALKTAEMIAANRVHEKQVLQCKELIKGARGSLYEQINIHSLRLPGVLAEQEVLFGQKGETLSIKHRSMDRIAYMPGLILACQKVSSLNSLHYGLEHLLDL